MKHQYLLEKNGIPYKSKGIVAALGRVCVLLVTIPCGCPNPEVVVFQPRSGTTTYLGYVAIFTTTNLALLPHLFQIFLDNSSSLLHPTFLPSVAVHSCIPISVLHPTPTSSPGSKGRPPLHILP